MDINADLVIETVVRLEPTIISRSRRKIAGFSQRTDVDDVVQMVVTRALRHIESCRAKNQEQLDHWILVIARNVVKSLITRHHVSAIRSTRREECVIGIESKSSRDGYQPADLSSDPYLNLEVAESTQAALEAIEKIHPRYALAVRMRYMHQMENQEIAAQLGISNEAARLLVSRGLKRIKKLLLAEATDSAE